MHSIWLQSHSSNCHNSLWHTANIGYVLCHMHIV